MSLLILSLFLLSACTEKQVPDGVSKQDIDQVTQPKYLTRDEFRNQLKYRSPATVIDLIGKPDSTSENSDIIFYYYNQRTIDPVTEKLDSTAQITFNNQEIESINFY